MFSREFFMEIRRIINFCDDIKVIAEIFKKIAIFDENLVDKTVRAC